MIGGHSVHRRGRRRGDGGAGGCGRTAAVGGGRRDSGGHDFEGRKEVMVEGDGAAWGLRTKKEREKIRQKRPAEIGGVFDEG